MRWLNAAAFLGTLAIASLAYGDAVVGHVINKSLSGGLCSSTAASSSSVGLSCGSGGTDGEAKVNASVGPLDARMQVFLSSYENPMNPGMTTIATTDLSWMITGGSGYGYVEWSATSDRYGEGGGGFFGPCSIALNGVTESCDLNAGGASGSFLIPYDTPVTLLFGVSYFAGTANFDAVYSGMDFEIAGLKPVDPSATPEPQTWTLTALAMAFILCLRMRRLRSAYRVPNCQR